MEIVVCVKVVPKVEQVRLDPITKTVDRTSAENELNDADKNAVEAALQLKDRYGSRVTVLSMGPLFFEPLLKLCVAMGADDAILLSDKAFAGADTYATSYVLAQAIKRLRPDIILCGESTSDSGTAQVPPQIAEWLGYPNISYVSHISIEDRVVVAKRTVKGGYEVVKVPLPVVMSVELGSNTPRFPDFKRKRWAEREFKITIWTANDLELDLNLTGKTGSKTEVIELHPIAPPQRLRKFLEGSEEEKARAIIKIIRESKG
ncbi:Caffeyl-CoA reductase-Etf complex subunit CarD [Candidatus Calditenuaceae archaeon HR02]|nr:Caffeyl-CoA reductase-Etf complex subunit CarD [Candidatus Calditenuaceae archaeon HR02]